MKTLLSIATSLVMLVLPVASHAKPIATNSSVLCSCHCTGSNSTNIKLFAAPGGDPKNCAGMAGTQCVTPVSDPTGGKLSKCVGVVGKNGQSSPRPDLGSPGGNGKLQ